MLSKHYQTQDHSNPHLGLCFFNSYITTAKSTAATLCLCNREQLGMKTSTGNQEERCLNLSAAVSLLYAHTSPVIPRKREAQTTQLHLVPLCLACMHSPHCCRLISAQSHLPTQLLAGSRWALWGRCGCVFLHQNHPDNVIQNLDVLLFVFSFYRVWSLLLHEKSSPAAVYHGETQGPGRI